MSALKERISNVKDRWIHMKSNVKPEGAMVGWQYGVLGFIGKKIPYVTYLPIHMDNERITAVQLISCRQIILSI